MDQELCKLTLVYPQSAADAVVELILAREPPTAGFTTWAAEGHGFGFVNASVKERVRGRVERRVLVAIMARTDADDLLEQLLRETPIRHLGYWIEPVLEYGRLAHGVTIDAAARGFSSIARG
jgi:hypothetical protein